MTNSSNRIAGIPGEKRKSALLSGKYLIVSAVAAGLLLFSSCEEKSTEIGIGLLPGSDFINISGTDTITPLAFTNYIDSVPSGGKTYSYLGGLLDTRFGYASADFVGQLRLTKAWPKTGILSIDSVKLFMEIAGAKGEYNTDIYMKIYEISELLFPDSSYYSSRNPRADTLLATFKMPVIKKDSTMNVVIKLADNYHSDQNPNPGLGEYFLRNSSKLYQHVDSIKKDFRSFFRGIYVTVADSPTKNNSKGGPTGVPLLMAYTFSSDNFVFRVYYHDDKRTAQVMDFKINNLSARYNRYFHDFSKAEPALAIKHVNDNYRDTVTYIQGLSGVFTKISLPGLEHYKTMLPLSVNKARLTVPVMLNSVYTTSTVPSRIYLSYTTTSGIRTIIPDYYVSSSFFDGSLNTSTKQYSFNVAVFVQEYLEGKIAKPEMEMYFSDGEYRNVILKSSENATPAKFNFVYTKR